MAEIVGSYRCIWIPVEKEEGIAANNDDITQTRRIYLPGRMWLNYAPFVVAWMV